MTASTHNVRIRPMRADDVLETERLTAVGYHELDQRTYQRSWPDPVLRPPERGTAWAARTAHLLATDPEGCWVAEAGDELVGVAVSCTRELMWILASFAVRPGFQGQGIGTQLMAAALHHGRGCLRGMLAASADPKALRRYRLAGFSLHPQMLLWGHVPREVIPIVERVRDGSPGDFDLMDSIDRRTRGAAHGPDHTALAREFHLLVTDRSTGSGYAYANALGAPVLVAATNRRTAVDLAWSALAASSPDRPVEIAHVTAANQWAIDIGMTARMELHQRGYLALRHLQPPAPYIHHGSFL